MTRKTSRPMLTLPIQSRPVQRHQRSEAPARFHGAGVEASKTRCADLTGPARQLCYQALYGVST